MEISHEAALADAKKRVVAHHATKLAGVVTEAALSPQLQIEEIRGRVAEGVASAATAAAVDPQSERPSQRLRQVGRKGPYFAR